MRQSDLGLTFKEMKAKALKRVIRRLYSTLTNYTKQYDEYLVVKVSLKHSSDDERFYDVEVSYEEKK